MKEKVQKHRLVLLLGILVALIFFYLGVNTWMENQGGSEIPPPVVRTKPPVQIKPPSPPVKPETPKPQPTPVAKAPKTVEEAKPVREVEETAPKPEIKKIEVKKPSQKKKVEKPKAQKREEKTQVKEEKQTKQPAKKVKKREEKPKKVAKKTSEKRSLEEYVVQIGAFKKKENADKVLKVAKVKGYDTFIIEEEGLYKVRVRVKAPSLISALRSVRKDFKNSFVVR